MRFLYRKSLFKNVFDQNFFICEPIFKIFVVVVVVYLLWHYLLPMASRCYGLFCAFSLSTFSLFALSAHA